MTYTDLITAAVAQARALCAGSLGDTASTPKVFSDFAAGVAMPYAVLVEGGEDDAAQSAGGGDSNLTAISSGQLQLSVFASSRIQARAVGRDIERALMDAPLIFDGGSLLELAVQSRSFSPEPSTSPGGAPAAFHRVILFRYAVQRRYV